MNSFALFEITLNLVTKLNNYILCVIFYLIIVLQFAEERNLDSGDRGSAALPFYSLINHSCDPNVARNSLSEHIVLYALYPIEKDTQVIKKRNFRKKSRISLGFLIINTPQDYFATI